MLAHPAMKIRTEWFREKVETEERFEDKHPTWQPQPNGRGGLTSDAL